MKFTFILTKYVIYYAKVTKKANLLLYEEGCR